jgi:hypothetical protein
MVLRVTGKSLGMLSHFSLHVMHTDKDLRMLSNRFGCLYKQHVAAGLVRWIGTCPKGA